MDVQANRVHLWCADLDRARASDREFEEVLSRDELDQAKRYLIATDKTYFIRRRVLLRVLLGAYLDRAPGSLVFEYGPWQKPEVAENRGLCFNVAYSSGLAVYAVARERRIGIDIERLRAVPDLMEVAASVLTAAELSMLRGEPNPQRLTEFFHLWTRKEAILKAAGVGLSQSPSRVEVMATSVQDPDRLYGVGDDATTACEWQLCSFEPALGYVGALAAEGTAWRTQSMGWL